MRLFEFDQTEELIAKLDKIENLEDPDFNIKIPAPIKVDETGDVWDYAEGFPCNGESHEEQARIRQEMRSMTPEIMDLPHNKLITGQDYVSGEGLRKYLKSPSSQLPNIYFHNGKYVVMDGNHRLVADVLMGKNSSKCNVFDMNEYVAPDGCFL